MPAESEMQGFLSKVGALAEAAYNAAMEGGEIQAFGRQGIGELGNALQEFPNSIHHEEPGAIFSPLHSSIAEGLEAYAPSPADLVESQAMTQPQAEPPQLSPANLVESAVPAAPDQGQQQTHSRGISI